MSRELAPGKIIISGEHAVVYGAPALVFPSNKSIITTITNNNSNEIEFNFPALTTTSLLQSYEVKLIIKDLDYRYNKFLAGKISASSILDNPIDLLRYCLAKLIVKYDLPTNFNVNIDSNLPIGCGMGSSAAAIISLIKAINSHFNLQLSPNEMFDLGITTENLQHGKSSGIDIEVAINNKGILYQKGKKPQYRIAPSIPYTLINTGPPKTTTGQSVEHVAKFFADNSLINQFTNITNTIDKALQNNDIKTLKDAIRANHKLLAKIGVVPPKVQNLINKLEAQGKAAKICGSGAITGDYAGIVIAF